MMINIALLAIAFFACWRADVKHVVSAIYNNAVILHLFFATTISLAILAWLRGGVDESMPQHFLGLCAATLILGQRYVMISCLLVSAILLIGQKISFINLGAALLFGMLLPCYLVNRWQQYCGGLSIWRFTLKVAVVGSILSLLAKVSLMSAYYYFYQGIPSAQIIDNYLRISLLFWVPELMLNATVILTLLQHRPHWIAAYQAPSDSAQPKRKS